jgi:hypothetical protein
MGFAGGGVAGRAGGAEGRMAACKLEGARPGGGGGVSGRDMECPTGAAGAGGGGVSGRDMECPAGAGGGGGCGGRAGPAPIVLGGAGGGVGGAFGLGVAAGLPMGVPGFLGSGGTLGLLGIAYIPFLFGWLKE